MPSERASTFVGVLGISCGLLRYMEVDDTLIDGIRQQSLNIWIVREWCLEHRIELGEFGSSDAYNNKPFSSPEHYKRSLAFHPFDSDIVYLDYFRFGRLFCCNLSTRIAEVVDCESYLKESLTPIPQSSWEVI